MFHYLYQSLDADHGLSSGRRKYDARAEDEYYQSYRESSLARMRKWWGELGKFGRGKHDEPSCAEEENARGAPPVRQPHAAREQVNQARAIRQHHHCVTGVATHRSGHATGSGAVSR